MSILSIQVDYQVVKIGINTKVKGLNYISFKINDTNIVYCFKLATTDLQKFLFHEFQQIFLEVNTLDPFIKVAYVCGYGTQEQIEYECLSEILQNQYKLQLVKQRGVIKAIQGLDYMINCTDQWFYRFKNPINLVDLHIFKQGHDLSKLQIQEELPQYPYLLVNVNKSVSFYKVSSKADYTKLSGSLFTDTTLENLLGMLNLKGDINQHLNEAYIKGNNINADLTVEDIYGENCETLGIPKNIIASSMGKLQQKDPKEINVYDAVKSLWYMFAINMGQLCSLNAQIDELTRVVVGSSKIVAEPFLLILQSTIEFFGKNKLDIYFIEQSEFLTCLGL